jgi:hypothetical protein
MPNTPASGAERPPLVLLVLTAAFTIIHALFVSAWARGHAPMPALAAGGYAAAALTGLAAVAGLLQRAPWLRIVAVPWGVVVAALGVWRALESTAETPLLGYANAVVSPLLYLWLAREMITAARAPAPPAARTGT